MGFFVYKLKGNFFLNFEAIKHKVEDALKELRINNSFLIAAKTNERTISHKLAEYLQIGFPDLNVDCEYNRHGMEKKQLSLPTDKIDWNDTEARTVFPDIIVHSRGNDGNNILVIEVKKSSNSESRELDENKLIAFTSEPYEYRFGLFLELSMDDAPDYLQWFSRGKVFHKEKRLHA